MRSASSSPSISPSAEGSHERVSVAHNAVARVEFNIEMFVVG
jgi:hypothetical protein